MNQLQEQNVFKHTIDKQKISEAIKTDGYFILSQFVTDEALGALEDESRELFKYGPPHAKNHLPDIDDGSYLIDLNPARANRISGVENTPHYVVSWHRDILSLAESKLHSKPGITTVIYDYREPTYEGELFPLHFDHFKISGCLKIYIHLSDIDATNGAMRYIPGTHNLITDVLKAHGMIVMRNISDFDNSLAALMHLIKQINSEVLQPHEKALNILYKIEANPDKSYEYALSGKRGDVVVFDPLAIHGGSNISAKSRHIFRVHYVDQNYVNEYLPEQMSTSRRFWWRLLFLKSRLMKK